MDSRNNFLKVFKLFIDTIDDEYLISATNKGTVNRAKKDLDKAHSIEYEIKDDKVDFKIDDIRCSIYSDINQYNCSCPSRSMCKHVIMSYLYVKRNSSVFFEDLISEDDSANIDAENMDNVDKNLNCKEKQVIKASIKKEFTNLKELSIEKIRKSIGERELINIIKRIKFGIDYTIDEGSLISVDLKDENIKVKLLDDLDNSVCSCKEKSICRHKAESIILYKLEKKYISLDELKKYENRCLVINKEDVQKSCREIQNVLSEILINGLSRLSPSILEKLNNCAVICHNYDLPNFEKSLRDIREEINLYYKKNASFTLTNLLNKITRLYMNSVRLEKTDDMEDYTNLAGEFKSSYYEVPKLELYGIGSETWQTKSGYAGKTYYFYENDKKQIFTFTKSAPVFYEGISYQNFSDKSFDVPWNLNCSNEQFSFCHLKLLNGKINNTRRISSSNKSSGFMIDKTNINVLNLENLIFDKFQELVSIYEQRVRDDNYNLVFVKGKGFGESNYDNVNQIFNAEIYDDDNNKLKISIPFSIRTKTMIKILEKMIKGFDIPLFFGRVYLKNNEMMFYPITYYMKENGTNLT